MRHVLVYDVGGSHVSAAVCAERTYDLRGLSRAPLPAEGKTDESGAVHSISVHSFGRLIRTLGDAALRAANVELREIAGAALAMPGPFDYENGISRITHKLQALYGVDLKTALAGRFGWEPGRMRFVNDAAAFLLGEVGAGAARGFRKSIGITLGTGIGCAYAADGRIAVPSDQPGGDPGVPPGGEIWNLPYDGKTVEDFVSTRYLRRHYLELTGLEAEALASLPAEVSDVAAIAQCREDAPCPPLEETLARQSSGVQTSAGKIAAKAARQAFADFGAHLGGALNQHAAEFKPDVVVLGGGIARASALFLPATRKALRFETEIAISVLMDEAPLAGAGVGWFNAE
jgi:glucokinase